MEEKYNTILQTFKENGCRITEQRKNLLAIILQSPGSSFKELYYLAKASDKEIGRATVYRTVHSLEEFGLMKKLDLRVS